MSQRDSARKTQAAAKTYLEMRSYEIIEQNWHLSRYKVDIVAKKDNVVYFVDVRYAYSDNQSDELSALSASQLKQARQAALVWVTEYKWSGEYRLAAIDIDSTNLAVLGFIDNEF